MPKVSIIIPVYNVEKYLRRCLDSIKAQTFQDFEAILVDDGSTDQSGVICDEYVAKDSRFVVIHKQNEGVVKTRITAFEQSKGELITFIDSDDYVDENYLLHLYTCINRYKVDVSSCQVVEIRNNTEKRRVRPELGYFDKNAIDQMLAKDFLYNTERNVSGMHLFLCAKMIKRCFVNDILKAGIGLWYGEDMVANLLLMQRISSMYISEEAHYYYIRHESQATMTYDQRRWAANIKLWERLYDLDKDNILHEQIPHRIRYHVFEFVTNAFSHALSFGEFKEDWKYVFKHQMVQDHFVNYHFPTKNIPSKFEIWTLQHNCPIAFYLFMKLREARNVFFKVGK